MKNFVIISAVVIVLFAGAIWWSNSLSSGDPSIISRNGLHWHPQLEIYVKGEKMEIPHDIGLTGVHSPIHTHEDLPLIHMEFDGLVRKEDTKLGNFFKVWGKDFMEFGSKVTMTVNGVENSELGNYLMKDGDRIVLRYE